MLGRLWLSARTRQLKLLKGDEFEIEYEDGFERDSKIQASRGAPSSALRRRAPNAKSVSEGCSTGVEPFAMIIAGRKGWGA